MISKSYVGILSSINLAQFGRRTLLSNQMVETEEKSLDKLKPFYSTLPKKNQILLYPQDNLSPVLCHAPVSRAWWTSSTGHVKVTRAVPRQWWSTWPEGHTRGMAPVVATSKGQSQPPGRRPLWPTQTHSKYRSRSSFLFKQGFLPGVGAHQGCARLMSRESNLTRL